MLTIISAWLRRFPHIYGGFERCTKYYSYATAIYDKNGSDAHNKGNLSRIFFELQLFYNF